MALMADSDILDFLSLRETCSNILVICYVLYYLSLNDSDVVICLFLRVGLYLLHLWSVYMISAFALYILGKRGEMYQNLDKKVKIRSKLSIK